METEKIYSPTQVALLSFFCGPLATVYFVYCNFLALDEPAKADKTLIIGGFSVILLMVILPFLPDAFPNMLIPMIYTLAGRYIVELMQMSKQEIVDSTDYTFQSSLKATGIAFVMFLAFALLLFGVFFALDFSGLISL